MEFVGEEIYEQILENYTIMQKAKYVKLVAHERKRAGTIKNIDIEVFIKK